MSRQTRKSASMTTEVVDSVHCTERSDHSKVLVVPKTVLENGKDGNVSVGKLRNPKRGTGSMFLFSSGDRSVFQMMNFNEKHRSWFIGDKIQQDGSLVFVTSIDPLFLVLPYLKQSNKFRPLNQVIVDDEFTECVRLLRCDDLEKKMEDVADLKESLDLKAFCFNESKCMKWLASKVEKLIAVLKEKKIKVTSGSQVATFVRSKIQEDSVVGNDDYLQYAHGVLSEYLPSDVSASLRKHLGISELKEKVSELPSEPAAKRTKVGSFAEPLEDYSVPIGPTAKKVVKLTSAQKALNKVDKSGMKSISSFFAKKTS